MTVRPSRRQSTVAEGGRECGVSSKSGFFLDIDHIAPGSATAPLLADLTESDNEDENDNVVRI